ncbi:MAG: ABC transporter substrate-binding protein, partial [Myxococcota bacterium]
WKKVRIDWIFGKAEQGSWKVLDIVTNDNSLVETYQEQFDKIIQKHSFDELLKRIKKKVNQIRKKESLLPLKETDLTASKSKAMEPRSKTTVPK